MGIITDISFQKNKKRVNIFVDGEFVSGLSFETAVKNGLKKGLSIEEHKLSDIIKESETLSAFSAGLDIIAISSKTSEDVKQKLVRKGFSTEVASLAVEKLKNYKYIDDLAYAKNYVKINSSKSKRELENKLRNKGVCADDIQAALLLVSDDEEMNNALIHARKYVSRKTFDERVRNNLFASLARKGYSLDTIYSVIDIIKQEIKDQ